MHGFSRAKHLPVCLEVWNGSRLHWISSFLFLKSKILKCNKALLYYVYTKAIFWPLSMLGILLDKIGLAWPWKQHPDLKGRPQQCLSHALKHTGCDENLCFTQFVSAAGVRWDSLQKKMIESKRLHVACRDAEHLWSATLCEDMEYSCTSEGQDKPGTCPGPVTLEQFDSHFPLSCVCSNCELFDIRYA